MEGDEAYGVLSPVSHIEHAWLYFFSFRHLITICTYILIWVPSGLMSASDTRL